MRRLIAILLFTAFCLPFASPAFALGQDADSSLPICCRRDGAHHCAMSLAERSRLTKHSDQGDRQFHAPMECCPFGATQAPSLHATTMLPTAVSTTSDAFFAHPTGQAQTESRRRIARHGSRHKRGPPTETAAA